MKKILVIGISGTGKTTFSRKISKQFGIPLFHMDEFWWLKNWTECREGVVEKKVMEILQQDSWIIEGYIGPATQERLELAEHVLYLDYSGVQACIGSIQRWWKYRGNKREEMAEGCIEGWNGEFFLKTILFRKERVEIEEAIVGFEDKIIRFKSRRQAKNWFINNKGKHVQ